MNPGSHIKAVLFDADNTLYDSRSAAKIADQRMLHFLAEKTGLEAHVIEDKMARYTREKERFVNGIEYREYLIRRALGPNAPLEHALKVFYNTMLHHLKPFPNTIRVLHELHRANYLIAVFSQERRGFLNDKLKCLNFDFDAVVSTDDAGAYKPHVNYYAIACRKLRVQLTECLVIGDNYEKDLSIPAQRGAQTLLFAPNGHPKRHIKNLADLVSVMR